MANDIEYPNPDYKEDLSGSMRFQRRGGVMAPVLILLFFGGVTLIYSSVKLSYFLNFDELLPDRAGVIFMVLGFVLCIIAINLFNRVRAKPFSKCSTCNSETTSEYYASGDFFVCHKCETFVRGDYNYD